jgi:hypothetical protein
MANGIHHANVCVCVSISNNCWSHQLIFMKHYMNITTWQYVPNVYTFTDSYTQCLSIHSFSSQNVRQIFFTFYTVSVHALHRWSIIKWILQLSKLETLWRTSCSIKVGNSLTGLIVWLLFSTFTKCCLLCQWWGFRLASIKFTMETLSKRGQYSVHYPNIIRFPN